MKCTNIFLLPPLSSSSLSPFHFCSVSTFLVVVLLFEFLFPPSLPISLFCSSFAYSYRRHIVILYTISEDINHSVPLFHFIIVLLLKFCCRRVVIYDPKEALLFSSVLIHRGQGNHRVVPQSGGIVIFGLRNVIWSLATQPHLWMLNIFLPHIL